MSNPKLGEKMLCAGTAACTADIMTFPLDVAKVRLQILDGMSVKNSAAGLALHSQNLTPQYRGLFGTLFGMIRNEGIKSLYGGISPGLQRQCVFASIRIGLYDPVKEFYSNHLNLGKSTSSIMIIRIASGITTGAIGIICAQAQTRGSGLISYQSSIQAYKSIYKNEGIKGLWKGIGPNVLRNSVVNAAELVCYDSIKELLLNRGIFRDGLPCHFSAAFAAGFCAALVSNPIDVVKTRYMNSTSQYSNVLDCAKCLVRKGGFFAFYKGFTPSFMRLGTWNICMFVTFEQLKKISAQLKSERERNKLEKQSLISFGGAKPATL